MSCHDCLESKEPVLTLSFVPCPTCNYWTCRHDMRWCPGGIMQPTLEREVHKLSPTQNPDNTTIVRSHSPIPGPCESCISDGRANTWERCRGRRTALHFRSHSLCELGFKGAYCPECTPEHKGRRCACGAVWLCDSCSVADPQNNPSLISCPRCGTSYCTEPNGCQYSYFCSICCQASICVGCRAREKGGDLVEEYALGEDSELLHEYKQCWYCRSYMCNDCCSTAKDGIAKCLNCHHWMCSRCSTYGGLCTVCSCLV